MIHFSLHIHTYILWCNQDIIKLESVVDLHRNGFSSVIECYYLVNKNMYVNKVAGNMNVWLHHLLLSNSVDTKKQSIFQLNSISNFPVVSMKRNIVLCRKPAIYVGNSGAKLGKVVDWVMLFKNLFWTYKRKKIFLNINFFLKLPPRIKINLFYSIHINDVDSVNHIIHCWRRFLVRPHLYISCDISYMITFIGNYFYYKNCGYSKSEQFSSQYHWFWSYTYIFSILLFHNIIIRHHCWL